MGKISENVRKLITARITESEQRLTETREWIQRLTDAGFNVTDLQKSQQIAELELAKLRLLL